MSQDLAPFSADSVSQMTESAAIVFLRQKLLNLQQEKLNLLVRENALLRREDELRKEKKAALKCMNTVDA